MNKLTGTWKMLAVSLFVILCGSLNSASSSCPSKCSCPHDVPRCSRGVGLALDSCGCCRVCARQLNEDCSGDEPCDHTKGLECNHGAGYGKAKGICRAKSDGRPCEFNSNMYQNGESFSPNCKHQCTCMDGAVGCVPLCPQELSLPNAGCAKPILFKVPGRCCEDLVCPGEGVSVGSAIKKGSEDGLRDKPSEDDLTTRNKLVSAVRGGLISLPAFKNQPETLQSSKGKRCVAQSSAWSPCSRSCGTGVSSRVTNNNSQCKLVKETHLCQVRPCSQSPFSSLKKGKKCSHTKRARQPVRLTYAGCRSIKSFRPRYCGSCLDGRCCRPQQTQTVAVCFRCEGGETLSQDVMMIQSCTCDFNCNDKPLAFYRRSNDIHKSKD